MCIRDSARAWLKHETDGGPAPRRDVRFDVFRDLLTRKIEVSTHTQYYHLVLTTITMLARDFGFATYKAIDCLKSYRGTLTYMAPEIKEGKQYRGEQVDIFSMGVILFIIVHGIFPFKEARKEEYFYNLLMTGQ